MNRWETLRQIPRNIKDIIHHPLRDGVRAAIDAIYPAQALDRDPHDPANSAAPNDAMSLSGLSAETWSKIRFLDAQGCDMCARPLAGGIYLGVGGLCESCTRKPFPFRRTRAACLYNDASKGLILPFKHADRTDIGPLFTQWISRSASDLMAECDVIVPVPLHWTRLWERRYNQAAELARPLARQYGKDYVSSGLLRVKATLRRNVSTHRANTLKGAFAVTPAGMKRLRGRHVVLVDDVFTTGATARACAETLISAGVRTVDVAVIARAAPDSEQAL